MYLSELNPINVEQSQLQYIYIGGEFDLKFYPYSIEGPKDYIIYNLDGIYSHFYSDILIRTYDNYSDFSVDFYVYADDKLVACAPDVRPQETNRYIDVNIYGAKEISLITKINGDISYGCGAWLNPQVDKELSPVLSALNDISIVPLSELPIVDTCIVTVSDANFISRVDTMLYSLLKNGNCLNSAIVLFVFGEISDWQELAYKYNAHLIQCDLKGQFSFKIKTAALSAAQVVHANKYLYLDADMLVLDDIKPIFDILDVIADNKIVLCKEFSVNSSNLEHAICDPKGIYCGDYDDILSLGLNQFQKEYPFIINNGVYAGTKKAILGLESIVRSFLPQSAYWEKKSISNNMFWREQAIFNIALARTDMAVCIDELYNLQLHSKDIDTWFENNKLMAKYNNKDIKILHFNGSGRNKYQDIQNYYSDLSISIPVNERWIISQNFPTNISNYCLFVFDVINENKLTDVLVIDNEIKQETLKMLSNSSININTIAEQDPAFKLQQLSNDNNMFDCVLINNDKLDHDLSVLFLCIDKILKLNGIIILHNDNLSKRVLKKIQQLNKYLWIPMEIDKKKQSSIYDCEFIVLVKKCI